MSYSVKELFYTLQGEGAQAGRAAVFCRFSGCNLWSGLEKDRQKTVCPFCDTDFVGTNGEGGAQFQDAVQLSQAIINTWFGDDSCKNGEFQDRQVKKSGIPYVVFTGGEPLLQLKSEVIELLHEAGFEVGVETNGTIKAPPGIDWLCVSPKQTHRLKQTSGQELKLLYPRTDLPPEYFSKLQFRHFFLQAVDEENFFQENLEKTVQYCLQHPKWRISLQIHKLLGLK
jgi:7-carboxy-7-deazaguanine synthase